MSLRDTACYTLSIIPATSDPNVVELVEAPRPAGSGEMRYARVRETKEGETFSSVIYDGYSGAKLGSAGFANPKDKKRRLELHNPEEQISFEFTGKLNFEWTFTFEGLKYHWTRELYGKDYICSLNRKPDPRVEICLARDADKKEPGRLQILHYNIDRFPDEIKDLRGLETLIVASLLCILDAAEERSKLGAAGKAVPAPNTLSGVPLVPQEPKQVISMKDYEPENPNEIVVGLDTDIDEHVTRAVGLLEDPNTLFIIIRTHNAAATQRALEVSLGVIRLRHRENLGDVNQYVVEEKPFRPPTVTPPTRPGPPVIKLDDPIQDSKLSSSKGKKEKGWSAPNITIYLSKIDLPDLKPVRPETLKAKPDGQMGGQGVPSPAPKSSSSPEPLPSKSTKAGKRPWLPSKTSPQLLPSPPASSSAPSRPPPPNTVPIPTTTAGGGDAKPNNGSGGVILSRLFKAAASKV